MSIVWWSLILILIIGLYNVEIKIDGQGKKDFDLGICLTSRR